MYKSALSSSSSSQDRFISVYLSSLVWFFYLLSSFLLPNFIPGFQPPFYEPSPPIFVLTISSGHPNLWKNISKQLRKFRERGRGKSNPRRKTAGVRVYRTGQPPKKAESHAPERGRDSWNKRTTQRVPSPPSRSVAAPSALTRHSPTRCMTAHPPATAAGSPSLGCVVLSPGCSDSVSFSPSLLPLQQRQLFLATLASLPLSRAAAAARLEVTLSLVRSPAEGGFFASLSMKNAASRLQN